MVESMLGLLLDSPKLLRILIVARKETPMLLLITITCSSLKASVNCCVVSLFPISIELQGIAYLSLISYLSEIRILVLLYKMLIGAFGFILANPCCSNPCQNRGVCMTTGFDQYECDCTRTGYYGENCTTRKDPKSLFMELKFDN